MNAIMTTRPPVVDELLKDRHFRVNMLFLLMSWFHSLNILTPQIAVYKRYTNVLPLLCEDQHFDYTEGMGKMTEGICFSGLRATEGLA